MLKEESCAASIKNLFQSFRMRLLLSVFMIGWLFIVPNSGQIDEVEANSTPKNIILFIGDGMGSEIVSAAGMYAHGASGTLSFEQWANQAQMTTHNATNDISDSGAAATALATCSKVNNKVISVALPGNGSKLQTSLEMLKQMGKSTGLVTTSTMTDATPAAFAAHNSSRLNYVQIASDYLFVIRPKVLFGGGDRAWNALEAVSAGYTIATNLSSLQAIDTETATHVAGVFGYGAFPSEYDGLGDLPTLSQMTTTALDILDNDPEGLFLLVEHEGTDTYGHQNDIQRSIFAVVELSNAVQIAFDWAAGRDDTLIVVTADHETGGLLVTQNNGEGNTPTVSWSTVGHTNFPVPVYAVGQNSSLINGTLDNTRLRAIMLGDEFSCPYYVPTKITLSEVKAVSGSWWYWGVLVLIAIAGMGFMMMLFRGSRRK